MILEELRDVIREDASVSIQLASNHNGFGIQYESWAECKSHLKEVAWTEEILLDSRAGIMIYFKNL